MTLGSLIAALALAGLAGNYDPAAVSEALRYFSPDDIARGRSYFAWGIIPALAYRILALSLVVLFVMKHGSIVQALERRVRWNPLRVFTYAGTVLLALEALVFPFAVVSGFYRNKIFGLLAADFPLWAYRYLLSNGIELAITAGIITLFLTVIGKYSRYRMLIPALFLALSLAGVFLQPRVVTPLFYSAAPMQEGELKTKIGSMLVRAGVGARGIYVINESRYTKLGNAYFTGWGRFREIYVYDTIIAGHSADEVCAVVAHELCHYREEHVLLGLVLGALGLFLGLFVIDRICVFLLGENLAAAARSLKVPHIMLIFFMVLFAARPVINGITRVMERRCDAYALELTGRPDVFIEMERKLAVANRANILPNPVFHWYYGTHPPVMERIRAGELFAESRAGK
jgi:STE24 endopeptidase